MEYDQERLYLKGQCLEYHATDLFEMMVDMAFEPRSELAIANAVTHSIHTIN